MILQRNSIKRGDWLLNVPLDSVRLLNDPHRAERLIANAPLFMLLLTNISYIHIHRHFHNIYIYKNTLKLMTHSQQQSAAPIKAAPISIASALPTRAERAFLVRLGS